MILRVNYPSLPQIKKKQTSILIKTKQTYLSLLGVFRSVVNIRDIDSFNKFYVKKNMEKMVYLIIKSHNRKLHGYAFCIFKNSSQEYNLLKKQMGSCLREKVYVYFNNSIINDMKSIGISP